MALKFTTALSSVFVDSNDSLGSDILREKFKILLDNDVIVNQSFSGGIGIWQCSWYYDSSIKGYSKGDAVWLNTEEPMSFVKSHAATIKQYTDLNSSILTKLPDFNEDDESVLSAYLNALTGYTDQNLGRDVILQPIFDIGDFKKPIQLAVSLVDNNKQSVLDSAYWKTLFVNTDEDETNIQEAIDEAKKSELEQHLIGYHLSGHEESAKRLLSNYLDEPNKKLSYDSLPANYYYSYSDSPSKTIYGFDYVEYSIRKPILLSGIVSQYQMVRRWHSGMLEHFGVLATDSEMFRSSNGNEFVIPFNWKIANDASGAKVYNIGELARSMTNILSALETSAYMVAPEDNFINIVFDNPSVTMEGKSYAMPFANADYNVTIHPVYQDQNGLQDEYLPISYGEEEFSQRWNSNYLTNEILRKTKNYVAMRRGTRVLAPYISYYAVGRGAF